MKKYYSNNEELNEILVNNGIDLICNDDMEVMVNDMDAERIEAIVKEQAPAAIDDYTLEDVNVQIPRIDYKLQVLEENNTDNVCSICEYIRYESENDPGFFRWLFEDENLSDFECPNEDEFKEFLKSAQNF